MIIAQIKNEKVHWKFDSVVITGEDAMPDWPPDELGNPIILVDITRFPQVQEGWDYDAKTGKFGAPSQEADE